jgi:hypothetical protein
VIIIKSYGASDHFTEVARFCLNSIGQITLILMADSISIPFSRTPSLFVAC